MSKISIGMVLSQLMKEKNLSVIQLADGMGKTRQNIYMDLKRSSMRDDQISEWAKVLKIDKQIIYDRLEGADIADNSFGSNVLVEIKRMIEEELREKNEQIRSLQESLKDAQAIIKMAMGKPNPAPVISKVLPLYGELLTAAQA